PGASCRRAADVAGRPGRCRGGGPSHSIRFCRPAIAGRRLPAPRRPLIRPGREDHSLMSSNPSAVTSIRPHAVAADEDHAPGERGLPWPSIRVSPVRQAWVILTARYLRQLYRVPVVIFMTLIQPVIWLLLFGALFKRVAEIPGFGGGNYITYLTPGVVIM